MLGQAPWAPGRLPHPRVVRRHHERSLNAAAQSALTVTVTFRNTSGQPVTDVCVDLRFDETSSGGST